MRNRWIVRLTPAAASLAALVGSAQAAMPPVTATAETQRYRLELDIGASEKMYSKADADKLKPAGGEIMVSGTMTDMPMTGAMPDGMPPRHLEVHVLSKATGKAVRDAKVAIAITDMGKQAVPVPVVAMYGITEGLEDWHYGNNVMLPPGEHRITVTANGEQASFAVTLPAM